MFVKYEVVSRDPPLPPLKRGELESKSPSQGGFRGISIFWIHDEGLFKHPLNLKTNKAGVKSQEKKEEKRNK
jgi:hypothetical protein